MRKKNKSDKGRDERQRAVVKEIGDHSCERYENRPIIKKNSWGGLRKKMRVWVREKRESEVKKESLGEDEKRRGGKRCCRKKNNEKK